MARLHQLKSYFSHWLQAVDEHSLHSPFFYNLYTRVIKKDTNLFQNVFIEEVRDVLLFDDRFVECNDLGTGPINGSSSRRRVSDIAKTSLAPQKYARLYQRLLNHSKGKNIIELGTSLGITSLYLAQQKETNIFTFEGSPAVADLARRNFKFGDAENIEVIVGDIARTLPAFLAKKINIDLVLMDANHRYEPTISYFKILLPYLQPSSIVILDDIHLSEEMERAWATIKSHDMVHGSIDLFRCGIVFFDPSLNKQHVVLQLN